jgi:hypothetical protein
MTYQELIQKVDELMREKLGDEAFENGHTCYKWALSELGFKRDGYDEYGAQAFKKDGLRVTAYYDRGDCCWMMEPTYGRSETTDNFYNTSSEMRDENGIYGRGSMYDPWNY